MTAAQLASVKVIADYIFPREGKTPSASDVGVHQLIDEWVSAPYPEFEADRELITAGLHHLDLFARLTGHARDFATANAGVQREVLTKVGDVASALPTAPFWKRLRRLILGGYYTTEAGFADIGYIGNVALKSFPAPTPEIVAAVERAAQQLGLNDRIGSRA
nr:gluconate 2-dehydrogenase subunit 3 family protein [Sphingomonas tagetis]